jgi:hypothetical protein
MDMAMEGFRWKWIWQWKGLDGMERYDAAA